MKKLLFVSFFCLVAVPSYAQIDCDVPAPTQPTTLSSGAPYTIAFCVPAVVTITNPDGSTTDVPVRVDGYTATRDANPSVELGKLTAGAPSPVSKLMPVTYRTTSGVAKGQHNVVITPWNCPIDAATGSPMTTCTVAQRQNGPAVSIPFVAIDTLLIGPPPAIQKGRIIK